MATLPVTYRTFRLTAAMLITITPCSTYAANTGVDTNANFVSSFGILHVEDMDFGNIDFVGSTFSSADLAKLGTDGSVSYTGNFSGDGNGAYGRAQIIGATVGQTIDLHCTKNAMLANDSGSTIGFRKGKFAFDGEQAPFPSGHNCTSLNGSPSYSFVVTSPTVNLYFGGQLRGNLVAGALGGEYSTLKSGGSPMQVEIVYQ